MPSSQQGSPHLVIGAACVLSGATPTDASDSTESCIRAEFKYSLLASAPPRALRCGVYALQLLQSCQRFFLPKHPVVDAGGIQRTTGLIGELFEVADNSLITPCAGTSSHMFCARNAIAPPPSSRPRS